MPGWDSVIRNRDQRGRVLTQFFLLVFATGATAGCGEGGDASADAGDVALTVADTGATLFPPDALSMDLQHHTMQDMQSLYDDLVHTLNDGEATESATHARELATLADRLPAFMVHVQGVTVDSMISWGRRFKGEMLRVAELAESGSMTAASELGFRSAMTCAQCHTVYGGGMDTEPSDQDDGGHAHDDDGGQAHEHD